MRDGGHIPRIICSAMNTVFMEKLLPAAEGAPGQSDS